MRKEIITTVNLELSLLIKVGPDCDGGEELREILFVDITKGVGIDISNYQKDGMSIKEVLLDKIPKAIMTVYRKQKREILEG